ncbi:MAG: RNA-processing protein [Candidatus Brockarchaeota archaeon]|nr:RNA-processing protein [Candidatus Brockarchaeota archaeon]
MVNVLFLDIPQERIGVLIGKNGEIKRRLEEEAGVKIHIQPDGLIKVEYSAENPELYFKLKKIAEAISCGFSGEDALRLLDDSLVLRKIDLRDFANESSERMKTLKGRIIGSGGRVWKKIEKLADVKIAIYKYNVGIIGSEENCEIAYRTILKILEGSQFSTVFRYLETQRKALEKGLWISRSELTEDEFGGEV